MNQPRQSSNLCLMEGISKCNTIDPFWQLYWIWIFILYGNCTGGREDGGMRRSSLVPIISRKNIGPKADLFNKGRDLKLFWGNKMFCVCSSFPLFTPVLPCRIYLGSIEPVEVSRVYVVDIFMQLRNEHFHMVYSHGYCRFICE